VPKCTSADYVPALLEICRKEHVALLVPTIDTELPVLSGHTTDFQANGTRVVISAPEVIRVARDKLMTVRTLEKVGVPTPRTLVLKDYRKNPSAISGPVIAKPVGGSASIGLVRGQGPADFAALPQEGYLVQECWDGIEYTVNVFFDQQGELRCAVPHRRIEVRAGEVSKGRTERVPQLEEAARKIAAALPGARGPLCFQAIVKDSGEYAVFEINARFGGGYPLTHHAGARFAQWLLEEAAGMPCTANNDWKAGVTMLRYDAAVFVDD
jgi:carbamoyl-phosphate synthase large subunit